MEIEKVLKEKDEKFLTIYIVAEELGLEVEEEETVKVKDYRKETTKVISAKNAEILVKNLKGLKYL